MGTERKNAFITVLVIGIAMIVIGIFLYVSGTRYGSFGVYYTIYHYRDAGFFLIIAGILATIGGIVGYGLSASNYREQMPLISNLPRYRYISKPSEEPTIEVPPVPQIKEEIGSVMYCSNCGKRIEGGKFCKYCGAKLG